MEDFLRYVNIKQGTASHMRFSTGNTLPLVAVPWGMNALALQTAAADEGWFYHPAHRQTEGVRLTHQPSPWVRDYAHFVFMPQSGEPFTKEHERTSGFEEISMSPACMALYFKRYRAFMALVPTERGAILRLRWDTADTPRFAVLPFEHPCEWRVDASARELSGWLNAHGDGTRRDFRSYVVMQFDQPIDTANTVGSSIAFRMAQGETLTVRMATSYVSVEQARRNLSAELADKPFDVLKAEAAAKWNDLLGRIVLTDTEERKRTFYSCLYRCFLFPRVFHEFGADGQPIHYSTRTGDVSPGVMYTDNGFWDTCRTLYPLLTMLVPERVHEMLQGYLNFYREEGWLPKWVSPGERGIMPGTLVDAVLADAAVKGLLTRDEMALALEGMLKNATTPGDSHLHGRVGVADYVRLGYVPCDKYPESANNTLDAAYCDWCIAQVADRLGKADIRDEFLRRSRNYRSLFDPAAGFLRGRNADGSFPADFSPTRWGGEYCEGAAWQNAFGVYHDVDGLASLYGGRDGLIAKLDELFATPPVYEVGSYHAEIHEMTEMAAADFGQCAISNQPSFHLPYLYAALGQPEKTAYWVTRIVSEAFTPDAFPGDEDNGSMAAWYVWSVLGLYPLCPGRDALVHGACQAERADIHLPDGTIRTVSKEEKR